MEEHKDNTDDKKKQQDPICHADDDQHPDDGARLSHNLLDLRRDPEVDQVEIPREVVDDVPDGSAVREVLLKRNI